MTAASNSTPCHPTPPAGMGWLDRMVRLRFHGETSVWVVNEIVERGAVISRLDADVVGPHKHLCEWEYLKHAKAV